MRSRVILSRLLLLLYLITVGILCFISSDSLPSVKTEFFGIPVDKLAHFLMFFPFPILFFLSTSWKTDKFWQILLYTVLTFIIGAAIAAATEWIQGFTATRSPDKADFIADAIALGSSCLIILVILLLSSKKK